MELLVEATPSSPVSLLFPPAHTPTMHLDHYPPTVSEGTCVHVCTPYGEMFLECQLFVVDSYKMKLCVNISVHLEQLSD